MHATRTARLSERVRRTSRSSATREVLSKVTAWRNSSALRSGRIGVASGRRPASWSIRAPWDGMTGTCALSTSGVAASSRD